MVQIVPHTHLLTLHASSSAFTPSLPISSLPYLAFFLLSSAFLSAFYFSTLPTRSVTTKEVAVAVVASLEVGLGVVALFCAVGIPL